MRSGAHHVRHRQSAVRRPRLERPLARSAGGRDHGGGDGKLPAARLSHHHDPAGIRAAGCGGARQPAACRGLQHRARAVGLLVVRQGLEGAARTRPVLAVALVDATFESLLLGFSVAFRPDVLWYAFLGCLVGTLVGMLPGIGPLAGISILLPITFGLDATKAIVMLAGIYYGSQYGGSTTSILLRIPGEAASVMTCI